MKAPFFILSALSMMVLGCNQPNNPPANGKNSANARTPDEQSETEGDRLITQNVRRAIMRADSLSVDAKNVKIITINGTVQLRGVVENTGEKQEIDRISREVAGVKNVDNRLEVSNVTADQR